MLLIVKKRQFAACSLCTDMMHGHDRLIQVSREGVMGKHTTPAGYLCSLVLSGAEGGFLAEALVVVYDDVFKVGTETECLAGKGQGAD
ncbi:MAG: hypothetical protein KJ804_01335 [Proteobacteria bacterium]|nr:hypothetical protein [Pseudomonadota bacterium]MBU1056953.1 hypothetical protein [Pseudomonadota bacterium]